MTPTIVVAWMAQTVVVSTLLCAAALLVQRVARHTLPSRLIWNWALFGTLAFVVVAPWRAANGPPRSAPISAITATSAGVARDTHVSWSRALFVFTASTAGAVAQQIERLLTAPPTLAAATLGAALGRAPRGVQLFTLLIWPLSSSAVLLILGTSYRRHRRELQHAAVTTINGVQVSVTPALGPAVIGVRDPRIVVPTWLLERAPEEQALVIAHEQSHIAAHDPLMLIAGCVAVAIMPWNPLAWFALARLRLAIEIDCDHRMLGNGASPRHYGQLLIDLSMHVPRLAPTPLALTAPAFSHRATHLERRLLTMTDRPTRHIRSRRIGGAVLATLALLAACESQLPTAAELQSMDVKGAEKRIALVTKLDTNTTLYIVDGKQVSRADANALSAENIATINVRGGKTPQVLIATKGSALPTAILNGAPARVVSVAGSKKPFDGLLLIDGEKVESSKLNSLSPDLIESIEVMKGEAAKAMYGEAGANGVIKVTTKKK